MPCKPNAPISELKKVLNYSPETGKFVWRVSVAPPIKVGQIAGAKNTKGYIYINYKNKEYNAGRLAWAFMTGEWPQLEIDHIDHVRDNNKWANLREGTHAQNCANRVKTGDFKGISWKRSRQKWEARIVKDGQTYNLGIFLSQDEAYAAYKLAAILLFGEFASI